MTPAEQRVYAAMERAARAARPDLRAALLRLFRLVREALTDAEWERLLRSENVEAIVREVVAAMEAERAVAPMREAIRTAYQRAATGGIRILPLPRAVVVEVAFDFLNPTVVEAIRTLESRALSTLTADVAETVRVVVRQGLEAGVNPRALVPTLKRSIGLAPNQAQEVENFRRALESGDFAKARGYRLRDKRFDAALKRGAPLTPERIDTMVDRYRQRRIAWNAETQARTAALDASRAGQRASWEAAIRDGELDRARVRKRWVTTLDGRERPTHHDMHGVEVPFDARFPVDGGVLVPGENAYNCRCVALYRYARA